MKAKNAALPLVIAVILSTLGIAFAAWTDQVVITGTAKMGTVTLAYVYGEPPLCTEYHDYNETGLLVVGEYLNKNVSDSSAWYSEEITDTHTEKKGFKQLNILIDNAYPSLHVFTTYKLHNIGSIPIEVYGFNFSAQKFNKSGDWICDLVADSISITESLLYEDYNGNGRKDTGEEYVMWLRMEDSFPFQLDPCHKQKREFDIHFLQPAQQCHNYLLEVHIFGIQWNKLYEVT